MDSLQDLNNFGNVYVTFEDDRSRSVSLAASTDLTATAPQNATWGPPSDPNGVISAQSVANNCTFTVNVGATGAVVTWPNTLPKDCTYSNPSTGVYRITGPITKGVWDEIKVHNVTYPTGYATANTITYTIDLLDGDSVSWDLDVTIEAVYQLGTTYTYGEDERIIIYDIGGDAIADPLIVDSSSGGKTYTILLQQTSPTDNYGYWATSANTTPVLGNITITGNVTAINDSEIFYTPVGDYTGNISFRYQQWRYDPSTSANVHQITNHVMIATHNGNVHAEYTLPVTNSYATTNPSQTFPLYNGYQGSIQITDEQAAGSPSFSPEKTYSVTVENIGTIAGHFTANGANIGNPGTITGNITTVNTALSTLTYVTDSSLSSNTGITGFVLEYNQTQTRDNVVQAENVTQNITLNMPPQLSLGTFYPEFGGIYIGRKEYNVGSYQESGEWELFLYPNDLTYEDGTSLTGPFRRIFTADGEVDYTDLIGDYYSQHNGKALQDLADADGLLDDVWGTVGGVTYYRYSPFRLCRELTAYGYSDYYLPAIQELYMAREYTDLASTGGEEYWSSSPESTSSYQQWELDESLTSPFPWENQLSARKTFANRCVAIRRIPTYPGA